MTEEYFNKLDNISEILKVISHPTRLCIVCKLMLGDLNVSQMQDCLEKPQSTVSQHLSLLKTRGIIEGKRYGVEVIYSLVNDDVKRLIEVFFTKKEIPK
jgi:ArsR family transcriptional regulator